MDAVVHDFTSLINYCQVNVNPANAITNIELAAKSQILSLTTFYAIEEVSGNL